MYDNTMIMCISMTITIEHSWGRAPSARPAGHATSRRFLSHGLYYMCARMYLCMHECIYVFIGLCLYKRVYIYIYICTYTPQNHTKLVVLSIALLRVHVSSLPFRSYMV